MSDTDILAQLRAWRDEFAKSHGYDIHAMAAALRELERGNKQKVVHGQPRQPVASRVPNQALQPTGAATSASDSSKVTEAAPAAER